MKAFVRRVLWVLAGLVVLPIVIVGVLGPPSVSGFAYLVSLLLMWVGLASVRKVARALRWVGLLLFIVTALVRVARPSDAPLRHDVVGEASALRWGLARLVDERDMSVGASRIFRLAGVLPPRGDALPGLFNESYDAMNGEGATPSSPLLSTLLLGQSAESFDMLQDDAPTSQGTLVFLHGFGGHVSAICWELAQSARRVSWETRCPSTHLNGRWHEGEGPAIVRQSLEGATRPVVLVGLSAGARGAAMLAPRLRGHIDGLILLSGAARRASHPRVPTLVLYGRDDRMFPSRVPREYAARFGAQARVIGAGHFIVLSERERVRDAVEAFLRQRRRAFD
ncbi:MAG: alpha/beta hydrolase [Myxococcota bacterium]